MRDQFDAEMRTNSRKDSAVRRFGIPIIAAAAVAALAIGGYAIAGDGSPNGNEIAPAGQGEQQPGDREGKADKANPGNDEKEQTPKPPAPTESVPIEGPDAAEAYKKCITLVKHDENQPTGAMPTGRVAIENDMGITVLVANENESYTCNVKPDLALSHPEPIDSKLMAEDFWFALNYTGNYVPGEKGEMVWAGGQAPEGVTGISYAFPDGHTENAVVQDGFWALQYFSEKTIHDQKDKVEVTVEGAGGKTFSLPFNADTMCNQVSHGC